MSVNVKITYSPNRYDVGTIKSMDEGEARVLINEGRAVYHYEDPPEDDTESAHSVPESTRRAPAKRAPVKAAPDTEPPDPGEEP